MDIEDIKENYYFETLNENHDLSQFDCGDEDLNKFLKEDALAQQDAKLNITKLIIYENNIIGFVSLLTDKLVLKNLKDNELKIKIKGILGISSKNREISAVKIGRFAVDKNYSRKGIGSHILRNILHNLKKLSENKVGFRFIIIESYAKSFNFYVLKNGFEYLEGHPPKIIF